MITLEEFQNRRRTLAKRLSPGSIAIIPSAHEVFRNGDTHYRFRQDSDFYYLTGFNEPDALLIILAGEEGESYLFNRPRNPAEEQWTGRRLGQEEASRVLGVKKAYAIESLNAQLPQLLADRTSIYLIFGHDKKLEQLVMDSLITLKKQVRKGVKAPERIQDLSPVLSEMRLFKSKAEIEIMRKAAQISVDAHLRAMRYCTQAQNEFQLEAELMHEFYQQGCRYVAYDPIVGSGANTCILHYTENNRPLRQGDLVLIDAGGEYQNYSSDITRTFPVSGCFSEDQKAIYELVLKAQKAGIACIKPGVLWNEIQKTMVTILTTGLCELDILDGPIDKLVENEAYKPFYMHNSGHWLGLDTHDCGAYKINGDWRPLQEGMVLTVEPGLYISAGLDAVDKRWWNIGVRIEDDILVTENGHENLTGRLPKEVEEIEALMRE